MEARHVVRGLFLTLTLGVVWLTGCTDNEISALPVESESVLQFNVPLLIGETPTARLVGVRSIQFDGVSRGFKIGASVNEGLFTASRRGNPDYCVQYTLSLTNGAGQSDAIDPTTQLLKEIKIELADPRPHPFIEFDYLVPWDGTDAGGNILTGFFDISYSVQVGMIDHNDMFVPIGGGPVTGMVTLFIEQEL